MAISTNGRIGHGPELYNEVQRLIFEWRGCDADDQRKMIPQLVKDIIRTMEAQSEVAMRAAAHDDAEAA